MPSTMAWTSSIWAKQFAAVTSSPDRARPKLRAPCPCRIALDGRDAARIGDVADVGRLDAENAIAGFLEIRDQRAVVGADVDHQILLGQPEHGGALALQVGEIVAQKFRGAAGVGIFRREDDDRIDGETQLHQIAIPAMQQIGRKPRLLPRHLPDRHHLIDRRHVAERQHGIELFEPQIWHCSTGTLPPVPAPRATLVGNKKVSFGAN